MSGLDHKHFSGPEHGWEPEPGLPERLPAGETLLWQGAPEVTRVAQRVFHIRAVALYFGVLLLWKLLADWHDGASPADALLGTLKVLPLPLAGLAMLYGLAAAVARTTLYTLTDRRLVMRIGMVLTVTYNIPLGQVAAADLRADADGAGDLSLRLVDGQRIAYAHLWPHARPWRLARPEPMLRCVADAKRLAQLLSAAWAARQTAPAGGVVSATSVTPDAGQAALPLDRLAAARPA
ncbi:MAG: PH domain-containing protein [Rhodocyclaceae bacterium]|nr:PH domain-containing protein [Rhodocyclaceae bacterium]